MIVNDLDGRRKYLYFQMSEFPDRFSIHLQVLFRADIYSSMLTGQRSDMSEPMNASRKKSKNHMKYVVPRVWFNYNNFKFPIIQLAGGINNSACPKEMGVGHDYHYGLVFAPFFSFTVDDAPEM